MRKRAIYERVRPDGIIETVERKMVQHDIPQSERKWVSIKYACAVVDCSISKMWKLLHDGRIRSAKLDNKRLVDLKSVLDLIEGGVVTPTEE